MLRKEVTSAKLEEIGWETIPALCGTDYVTPLKDVAFYLREDNWDCKVEVDTENEYVEVEHHGYISLESCYEPSKENYYYFEYMYIRPHNEGRKWQKVARRKVVNYYRLLNKVCD
jgi:hypothetical protein